MDSSQESAFMGRGHIKDTIQLADERGYRRNGDNTDKPWTTNISGFDTELEDLTEPKSAQNRTVTWDEVGMKTTSQLQLLTTPLQLIHAQRDGDRDTPSSTGSASSTHMILNTQTGKRREFNPANMQQNTTPKPYGGVNPSFDNGHSPLDSSAHTNLAMTTRDYLQDRGMRPDDDNTTPKKPLDSAERRQTSSTDKADKADKGVRCLPRFIALVVLILLLLVGIVVIIYIAKENAPDSQHGHQVADPIVKENECLEVNILLGEEIKFRCTFIEEFENVQILRVRHPLLDDGDSVDITVNQDQLDWEAKYVKRDLELSITGPTTKCSSGGQYDLELINYDGDYIHNASVVLTVMSQLAKVNMSILQQNQTDTNNTDTNSTDFTVGCHTNSGCERAYLDLFSVINQHEQSLRKFDFSCTMSYNDNEGFSLDCQGTIPSHLLQEKSRIICRPSSSLLANVSSIEEYEGYYDLRECDLAQNCGYKCVEENEFYYAVNTDRCDIFHRCVEQRVYSEFCANGTFFNPEKCACDHMDSNPYWCQSNGAVRQDLIGNLDKTWCSAGNQTDSSTG